MNYSVKPYKALTCFSREKLEESNKDSLLRFGLKEPLAVDSVSVGEESSFFKSFETPLVVGKRVYIGQTVSN